VTRLRCLTGGVVYELPSSAMRCVPASHGDDHPATGTRSSRGRRVEDRVGVSDGSNLRAVMDVPVQVAGRATDFDAWIVAAGSALAASGQMRVPATALSKRTLAAMTWKPIAARLKTRGHGVRGKGALVAGSPVTGLEACLPELHN
jgi:hypothetical protein